MYGQTKYGEVIPRAVFLSLSLSRLLSVADFSSKKKKIDVQERKEKETKKKKVTNCEKKEELINM